MKQAVSPVAGGVIIAIVIAVALYFVVKATGPVAKSNEPVNMAKMMGKVPIAPPSNTVRPGMPGVPTGQGGPAMPPGGR